MRMLPCALFWCCCCWLPLLTRAALADVKAVRARWHPDRFTQKFGSRLAPGERDAIMTRVTEVASAIIALTAN
jgi:hypothetical protein